MNRKYLLAAMATGVVAILIAGFFVAKSVIAGIATNPNAAATTPAPPRKAPPSPTLSPTPSPTPVETSSSPSPPPPPSPPKTPGPPECGGGHKGEKGTTQQVNAALEKAAKTRFWTETPIYGVPPELIKGIAQMESGWFSDCLAADGGIGTMQLMQSTVDHMHLIFESTKPYGAYTVTGNTMIGSAYLQWLMREIGKASFGGNYSMDPASCENKRPCLLNAVIAAYNFGHQSVINELGDGDADNYPNPDYVINVRELMTRY